jgi:AcrR family transcriptional regulator
MPDRFRGVRETRATGRWTLPDAVSEEAFQLVEEEGPEQLNLRRLAERMAAKGMKFSKTAPLHHFGSVTGLYAAVARQGFDLMADRLRELRDKRAPTRGLLKEMTLSYGVFGLEHPHVYRAMHWPSVWAGVARLNLADGTSPSPAEMPWLIEVNDARDRAFVELIIAVQLGQAAGSLRTRWAARDVARVLTSLVDGYLFQTLVERVDAPFEILRDYLDLYIRMAIDGLGQPRKRKQA